MNKGKRFVAVLAIALGASIGAQGALLSEDFEGATDGFSNTTGVITGTVFSLLSGSYDIKGPSYYSWICVTPASNRCLDTTGGGGARGTIETTNDINFASAGTYTLMFSLVRWNDTVMGGGLQDATIQVDLGPSGSLFSNTYVVDSTWTNQTVTEMIVIGAPTSGKLRFTDLSGTTGYAGAVLDNVVLDVAVPEPSTFVLLGIGLLGAGFARRRVAQQ